MRQGGGIRQRRRRRTHLSRHGCQWNGAVRIGGWRVSKSSTIRPHQRPGVHGAGVCRKAFEQVGRSGENLPASYSPPTAIRRGVLRTGSFLFAATTSGKSDRHVFARRGGLADAYYPGSDQAAAKAPYEKAVSLASKQLEVNPKDAALAGDAADDYAMLGDRKHALALLDQSLRWGKGDKDLIFNAAVVYQDLGESGVALEWLKKSLDAGASVATVLEMPTFDSLKNDPRFQALVLGRTH